MTQQKNSNKDPVRFIIVFITLFLVFYYFNIGFWGVVSPGKFYSPFLAGHLNYIAGLRGLLIKSSDKILSWMGYTVLTNQDEILVAGHGVLRVAYSCLGLGVTSFFTAFLIAYPKPLKPKAIFMITGIVGIQLLNILRFVLLALFWDKRKNQIIDHHTIFNIFIYVVIMIALYLWIKTDHPQKSNAEN